MTIKRVSIIGAGTMGLGIAQVNAMHDIETTLIDINEVALEKAQAAIANNLEVSVRKEKITRYVAQRTFKQIRFATNFDSLKTTELLIEAVYENISLKKEIFVKADEVLAESALLASNTSSLSIGELSACVKRPEAFIGLHFFNPPHIMKLLEIIYAPQTSDETIAKAKAYAEQINKQSILVKDSPGFATSRLGICLANEAMRMLEEGVASVEDIDKAMMLGYGHPMGPLKLTDLVGLDVRLAISEYLYLKLGSAGFKPPQILVEKVAKKELGKKNGQGFYKWG